MPTGPDNLTWILSADVLVVREGECKVIRIANMETAQLARWISWATEEVPYLYGEPAHGSPERARDGDVDGRSDIHGRWSRATIWVRLLAEGERLGFRSHMSLSRRNDAGGHDALAVPGHVPWAPGGPGAAARESLLHGRRSMRPGALGGRTAGRPGRLWSSWIVLATLAGVVADQATAAAEPLPDAGAGLVDTAAEGAAQDSPRASLTRFLDLCRDGDYAEAAGYLDLPPARRETGAELARRLKAVLDRHVWFDLSRVSPAPEGDLEDGLPSSTDEVGQVPGGAGVPEPVRMVRRAADDGSWVFSRATVNRIDSWYARLEHRWLLEHLPDPLLRSGPRNLLYWQWLALPIVLALALGIGFLLSRLTRTFLARVAARTATRWDDEVLRRVGGPLTFAWTLVGMYVFVPWLGLYEPAQASMDRLMRAAFFVVFFWTLGRSVDVGRQIVAGSSWAKDRPASRSLLPLGARVAKVLVLAVAIVALLSELGYPVASLVAGLGIGGLALALAAQKTVENLFGAFSIGADQPFREGDFVRIEDFVGTVEAIGLRSTRIRTLDRTLITLPNGKLADMRLESFSARDRIRLACMVGLVYETTAGQMREVLEGLERSLRDHPKIWPDAVVVRFSAFGASSLDIEVMAWFVTVDWSEFQRIRQEVLLQFMEIVEKAGTSFAFPTRTLHVVSQKTDAVADGGS